MFQSSISTAKPLSFVLSRTDTTNMKFLRAAVIVIVAVANTACFGLDQLLGKSPTSPSDTSSTSVRSYLGTWNGPAVTSYPTTQSCGNMQWKITSQTGGQINGEFHATCAGGATLVGTVVATHSDTTIPWAASGTATQGTNSCPFSLTGTGTFQGTSNILVTYAGTVCTLPVSGSELITR
jgi:hypothetical protein